MRETPVFSSKIRNGRRTLRFMSVGCSMFNLWFGLRFRFRRSLRRRFGLGLRLGIGGGLRFALDPVFGPRFGFSYGHAGFGFSLRFVNRPDHVERALWVVFEFIAQDSFAAVERVFKTDEFSLDAAKLLGGEEWLREESLQTPGSGDYIAVFWRQLFQAKHGDDVLQIFVLRERPPDFLRQEVMPFADDAGRSHFGAGLQQIDSRVESFTRPLARKHDGCREMRERVHRRGVGQIVRRHIYRLNGRDGSRIGVGNALLQP